MKNRNPVFYRILLSLFVLLSFPAIEAMAQETKKVLVMPFNIHAEKELDFLRDGIKDMLITRMDQEKKVETITSAEVQQATQSIPGQINEITALSMGETFSADYVVLGSLTLFGESISTDIRLIDVNARDTILAFHEFGKDKGDVIYHIDQFAKQANEQVFGIKVSPGIQSDQKDIPAPVVAAPVVAAPVVVPEGSREIIRNTDAVTASRSESAFDGWKSRKIEAKINGVAVGDVDGDGLNETVCISDTVVYVYRLANDRMAKVAELKGKKQDAYIGVEVADINKNGKAEIFVTNAFEKTNRIMSYVLEWDGSAFTRISKNKGWYYRVLEVSDRGQVLYGQKPGSEQTIFKNGIYELQWQNGEYEPFARQDIPDWINIFGFAYNSVYDNRQETITAFTSRGQLSVLDASGSASWTSRESYGGPNIYIDARSKSPDTYRMGGGVVDAYTERYYLNHRVLTGDFDNDGITEVIIGNNQDASGGYLKKTRVYTTGYLECLTWDNVGEIQKWKTREVSGNISDYTVADFNNDGTKELIYAHVTSSGYFETSVSSYVVALSLGQ